MGSLSSRPDVPSRPQVVYVPAPAQTAQQPAPSTNSNTSQNEAPDSESAASEEREKNLLRRNRGLFGTVRTGFRGLLGAVEKSARKSLLGE